MCLQRPVNRAALSPRGLQFHLLFNRPPVQRVYWAHVAVTDARTHLNPTMVHFHCQSMATALGARRWNIAEQIEFILIPRDPLESTEQVIGVVDGETPRALCQRLQDLLVGGGRRRHLRQDRARRIVRIVVVVVVRRIDRPRSAASPSASRSAAASVSY